MFTQMIEQEYQNENKNQRKSKYIVKHIYVKHTYVKHIYVEHTCVEHIYVLQYIPHS